jgi:hypothetical protein
MRTLAIKSERYDVQEKVLTRWSYFGLILLLSLAYGAVLVAFPFDGKSTIGVVLDRTNYLVYAQHPLGFLARYWSVGPLAGLANEPLWLLINAGLATLLPSESVMKLIIFAPAVVVAWQVLRRSPRQFPLLILLLLLPQILNNHLVHLREGLAVAVFLTGWFSRRGYIKWPLIVAAAFIHSSFFFVFPLLVLAHVLERLRISSSLRTVAFLGFAVLVGVSIGWTATILGARQAVEYSFTDTGSGLAFIFWTGVLFLFCAQGRSFLYRHAFALSGICLYIGGYFFAGVISRVFEAVLVIVLLSGFELTGWRRQSFIFAFLSYFTLQWAIHAGQPLWGFGVA